MSDVRFGRSSDCLMCMADYHQDRDPTFMEKLRFGLALRQHFPKLWLADLKAIWVGWLAPWLMMASFIYVGWLFRGLHDGCGAFASLSAC